MKIYTYYEEIDFKSQREILKCWEKTWKKNGFETFIVGKTDAEKHPLFESLCSKLDEKNLLFFNKKFSESEDQKRARFHLSSIKRWLAWGATITEPSLIGDFDILNNGFTLPSPIENKLIFRDGHCLSFASGNGNHCTKFIECLIENLDFFYEKTDVVKQNTKRGYFHDQDFIVHMCKLKRQTFFEEEYNFGFDRYPIKQYDHFNENTKNFKLLHVSHNCANVFKKHITENRQDEKRLLFINKLDEDIEDIRVEFAENASNGIFYV